MELELVEDIPCALFSPCRVVLQHSTAELSGVCGKDRHNGYIVYIRSLRVALMVTSL